MRYLHNESGMTLMEIMVAMTISGILMTLIFQFFISQSQSFEESRMTSEMQQETRWAINYLAERIQMAGSGVPPTCGWQVIENIDGTSGASDSLNILGCYKSLVLETTQTMGNSGSQVKVNNSSGTGIGDLCVISDGTFTEIFLVTDINDLHLWHKAAPPWNDDNKLDHAYGLGSTVSVVSYYSFFEEVDEEGRKNLMVQTQAYVPQILIGDIDTFQIRFKMKDGSWIDDPYEDELVDIRMVEITVRAKSPKPLKGYIDPAYGDAYKRLEMKTIVIPKNITII
jgi:prepilin-type N-terminal cleavage/methylation domain-containing protein